METTKSKRMMCRISDKAREKISAFKKSELKARAREKYEKLKDFFHFFISTSETHEGTRAHTLLFTQCHESEKESKEKSHTRAYAMNLQYSTM